MYIIILRLGLYFIGLAGILIGMSFILFGVNNTGQFFNTLLSIFYTGGVLTGLDHPNAESELRFYSVFWIAYGMLLIRTSRNIARDIQKVPWLVGLFFAGGASRIGAFVTVGAPHALFIVLMVIELSLPIILYACFLKSKDRLTQYTPHHR